MSNLDCITILGTGAMACLFGAKLAPLADLTMLGAWPAGIHALQHTGIRLIANETETTTPVRALDHPAGPPADLALILVKGHQTLRAAQWAAQILKPTGIALTLQNGLGNLEILTQQLGAERAALGVSMQGATLLAPGLVRHGGNGPTTLATTPATVDQLTRIAALFQQASFETHLTADARALVWSKLVINAAINALTAILSVPNGTLAQHPDARAVMSAAALEAAAVAHALDISLLYPDPVARAAEVAHMTAANRSSMLQDVERGTPTEIAAINGAVVKLAHEMGMPVPVNETLLRLVRVMEKNT